jgi:hypothetical protein
MTSYNEFFSAFMTVGLVIFYAAIVLTAAVYFAVRIFLQRKFKKTAAKFSPDVFNEIFGETDESPRIAEITASEDPFLFNISVFDNIQYGKISASDEEVYAAAERAGIAYLADDQSCEHLTKGERKLVAEARETLNAGRNSL